jgi:hypothetical protein
MDDDDEVSVREHPEWNREEGQRTVSGKVLQVTLAVWTGVHPVFFSSDTIISRHDARRR